MYQDSDRHYADVLGSGADLRNQALEALLGQPAARRRAGLRGQHHWRPPRTEVVELPEGAAARSADRADGKPLGVASVPAYGLCGLRTRPRQPRRESPWPKTGWHDRAGKRVCARRACAADGSLVSLFDKRAGREAVAAGKLANHFVLFDDHPPTLGCLGCGCLPPGETRRGQPAPRSARVVEGGPLRAAVAFEYELSPNSTLVKQVVSLTAISPRLDFDTEVEWHERHKFLKVEFPLNVRADQATYEIQFGHLQRPTHFNTSWDMARFEVCGHQWADLSEPTFGVALLNDSKYGYATHGNVMRLSLLRAPTSPDPEADQGRHHLPLCPAAACRRFRSRRGDRRRLPLQRAAADPARTAGHERQSFFQVDQPGVVIDTVKKAEDSQDVIVRLYEATALAARCA